MYSTVYSSKINEKTKSDIIHFLKKHNLNVWLRKSSWNDYGNETCYDIYIENREQYFKCITDINGEIIISRIFRFEHYKTFLTEEAYKEFAKLIKDVDSLGFHELQKAFKKIKKDKKYIDALDYSLYRGEGKINMDYYLSEHKSTVLNLKYKNEDITIDYKSLYTLELRTVAIIGENGSGKTRKLKEIAQFAMNPSSDLENFQSIHLPSYQKTLYYSFGLFDSSLNEDNEEISQEQQHYFYIRNYVLNNKEENHIQDYITENIYKILGDMTKKRKFEEALGIFFPKNNFFLFQEDDQDDLYSHLSEIIDVEDKNGDKQEFLEQIIQLFEEASTGQKCILIFIISFITEIKEHALVFIDELEISQHPENIIKLVDFINITLESFDSYGIIVTHSPYVIQGIPSYLVLTCSDSNLKKIAGETFGQNINNLTNLAFDVDALDLPYVKRIQALKEKGGELGEYFESADIPLSVRLLFEEGE